MLWRSWPICAFMSNLCVETSGITLYLLPLSRRERRGHEQQRLRQIVSGCRKRPALQRDKKSPVKTDAVDVLTEQALPQKQVQ